MTDITAIFYTANSLHEPFAALVRGNLRHVLGDIPLISVSQRPMPWFGDNICVGDIGRSHLNIYRQILIGAKAAGTRYVACTEDDILYTASHFQLRPKKPKNFGYNLGKWSLMTWDPRKRPLFSYRDRKVVNALYCERDLLVEAMEERFAKFAGVSDDQIPISQWGDPGRYETGLGVTVRSTETNWSSLPNLVFNHEEAFGYLSRGTRKAHGFLTAYSVPYWGEPQTFINLWKAETGDDLLRQISESAVYGNRDDCWARNGLEPFVSAELKQAL